MPDIALLKVTDLGKHYSGVTAVAELSFSVAPGIIKSVIGPNGAGKTTLINLITGFTPPSTGGITLGGQSLAGLKPHQVAARGVARTFQTVELFPNLTVLENVMVGCHLKSKKGLICSGLRLPGVAWEEKEIRERALGYLGQVGLTGQAGLKAGSLPLGEQKLLEVARALASGPKLLLLDEPAAGLNENETARAAKMILGIRDQGVTIILVEHDMKMVMSISDEVLVINFGSKIAEGPPEAVKRDQRVIEAYLGGEDQYA